MQDVPHKPVAAPKRIEELTGGTQIGVNYLPLVGFETGDS
jgi:hypothetical protein